jgi:hypothetical protein
MAELRYTNLLVLVCLTYSCSSIYTLATVDLKNNLSGCIKIMGHSESAKEFFVYSRISYEKVKMIGDCGCTSALGAYTAYITENELQIWLASGKVSFNDQSVLLLPVATDYRIIRNRPVTIELSCADPD